MKSVYESDHQREERGRVAGTVARIGAAVAVFVSGLIHLQLYFDGYRDFPDENLGRSFLLNAVASVVVAGALVVRRDVIVRIAATVLLVATLIAFALSRTDRGIFGFTERGLEPSPQAAVALLVEIVGLVLLADTFVPVIGAGQVLPRPAALSGAAAFVVIAVVGGALWARSDSVSTADAPTTTATASVVTSAVATTVADTTSPASVTVSAPQASAQPPAASATSAPSPATTVAPTQPAASDVVTVSIVDFAFVEPAVTIPVGTTIEWVNNDAFTHSIVAGDGSFISEELEPGDTFSFTFDTPGDLAYICGIHPSMTGSIIVTA